MEALDWALELLSNSRLFYEHGTPHVRRLLNQAIFERLLILDDWVSKAEEDQWVPALHGLALAASRPSTGGVGTAAARQDGAAGPAPALGGDGLNENNLVRPSGL